MVRSDRPEPLLCNKAHGAAKERAGPQKGPRMLELAGAEDSPDSSQHGHFPVVHRYIIY